MGFTVRKLPVEAQYAPVYTILTMDINRDGLDDLLLFGNNKYNRIRLGRDDASHGTVLLNNGKGHFTFQPSLKSGITIRGDVRSAEQIGDRVIIGVNDDSVRSYRLP
jgi:hypothetical protein